MDGKGRRHGNLMVMDGAGHNDNSTVMGINGRSDGDLKAVDGLTAMDGSSTVMDGMV